MHSQAAEEAELATELADAVIDAGALAADAAALVQVPSVTGDERAGARAARRARRGARPARRPARARPRGAARASRPPGRGGARATELWGLTVTLPGGRRRGRAGAVRARRRRRAAGTEPWRHGPWSGAVEDGWLHGRGSVDMKGAVVAALHALAALRAAAAAGRGRARGVASEEDGGLGAFAALERDAAFDACLIPEPTGFDVVCAQAGALTFEGAVPGVAAHAAAAAGGRARRSTATCRSTRRSPTTSAR